MPISTEQYLLRLKVAIGSPETWNQIGSPQMSRPVEEDWAFRRVLFFYWSEIAGKHQSNVEMFYYKQYDAIEQKSEGLLKEIESNVAYWRSRATTEYLSKIDFFKKFRHATQTEHSKHWVVEKLSFEQLLESTRNGPAKYLPRYSLVMLERALYDAVRFNWRLIAEERVPHLYVEFKKTIGASDGLPCSHVRFDLDYSTGVVHSHPILAEGKPANEKWLSELEAKLWEDENELLFEPVIDEQLEYDLPDQE